MLWPMAESLSSMQFSEGVMFSTLPRPGNSFGPMHTNPLLMEICAGTGNPINGAPKI